MKKTLSIEGMTCHNCVRHVTEALEGVDGVSDVNVNLEEKNVELTAAESVSDEALKSAVKEAGYKVTSVDGA